MKAFALLFALVSIPSFASSLCTIQISSEKFNGEKVRITFRTRLQNKQECMTLAKLHQSNFQKQDVKSKQVAYVWDKPEVRQEPSIASRSRSPKRRYR